MERLKKDGKLYVRRAILIVYDCIAVFLAHYCSLSVRFEFDYDSIPEKYRTDIYFYMMLTLVAALFVFYIFHLYSSLWLYASTTEMVKIICAGFLVTLLHLFFIVLTGHMMPRSYYILYCGFLICLEFISRFGYRAFRGAFAQSRERRAGTNVMIVGAGAAGSALYREISHSEFIDKKVVCFVDDDPMKVGHYIHGVRIAGNHMDIPVLVKEYNIQEIMLAMPSAGPKEIKRILDICKETKCELKKLPGMYQLVNGEVSVSKLKEVSVEDLLGRDPVNTNIESIMGYVSGKVIMVTGGGGSIGSELCRQIAAHNPRQLILLDIYENTAYDIQQELKKKYPFLNLVVLIASVRNTKRLDIIFETYRPEIVYHAAAHKHVPLMEDSPNEAVKNNVLGTWKVVQASDKWNVKRFVMISTDKAVNPTNIMGATKRICEMIIQTYNGRSETEFVAVRFGNVLGSNGSVIPLFKKQILAGGPVTVTHPDIIRYFMTIPEAVSLVLQAGAYAKGGEIFVLDMGEPVKILDLAKNLILLSGHTPGEDIKIEFSGLRPGEKLYEEMLMKEEGMQETENKLIHIGKPIQLDEELFLKQLESLKDYVVTEPDDIRDKVREIVPTYVQKQ